MGRVQEAVDEYLSGNNIRADFKTRDNAGYYLESITIMIIEFCGVPGEEKHSCSVYTNVM